MNGPLSSCNRVRYQTMIQVSSLASENRKNEMFIESVCTRQRENTHKNVIEPELACTDFTLKAVKSLTHENRNTFEFRPQHARHRAGKTKHHILELECI